MLYDRSEEENIHYFREDIVFLDYHDVINYFINYKIYKLYESPLIIYKQMKFFIKKIYIYKQMKLFIKKFDSSLVIFPSILVHNRWLNKNKTGLLKLEGYNLKKIERSLQIFI